MEPELIADSNSRTLKQLFGLAVKDAGGKFPDYLIRIADNEEDVPGCSDLAIGK